jgi:hypothetical protein
MNQGSLKLELFKLYENRYTQVVVEFPYYSAVLREIDL